MLVKFNNFISENINEICERPHLEVKTKSFLDEYLREQVPKSITFKFKTYQKSKYINKEKYQYRIMI